MSQNPDIYFNPDVSFKLIQNSQNIEENNFNSLDDIYYHLSILENTGKLSELTNDEITFFKFKVQDLQNVDGGFGDWNRDRSKAGSTRLALDTLKLLNADLEIKLWLLIF